ncbi:hypothetical protein EVAR_17854_1 [Eumeta japonica]|uniref:Uncharacterized protein n=1 Tax=Eumeta variegata TaxID=151549 RepID=A0A4C1TTZ1_EUMVA|nr:hypothetical protein EVAR_17854_1 [Eumeta japonica]
MEIESMRWSCDLCIIDVKYRLVRYRNSNVGGRCALREDVVARVERGLLRRFGHLERMNENRQTKQSIERMCVMERSGIDIKNGIGIEAGRGTGIGMKSGTGGGVGDGIWTKTGVGSENQMEEVQTVQYRSRKSRTRIESRPRLIERWLDVKDEASGDLQPPDVARPARHYGFAPHRGVRASPDV